MNAGIESLNVIGRKEAEEAAYRSWAREHGTREQGRVLKELKKLSKEYEPYQKASSYMMECLVGGPEIFRFAMRMANLAGGEGCEQKMIAAAREFYKDYNVETDKKVTAALLEYYATHIDKRFHPGFLEEMAEAGGIGVATEALFERSMLVDSTRFIEALKDGASMSVLSDKAMEMAKEILRVYREEVVDKSSEIADRYADAKRVYMAARMEMEPEKDFYSDANFTMRLSYGQIGGYTTKDTTYTYFSNMDELMAKEDPDNWEFVVARRLKEVYELKDYGEYADADGEMHVCFISNNDITGGNSGSPVINGDGELIGLAFDGNWEAMSGDIIFEPALQRCICVDIRYVLMIIDKIGGARNLIDELTIRR